MKRIFFLVAFIWIQTGCFAPQQTTVSTKQTFNFDYSSKETSKLGGANMVIALVKPYYATSFTDGSGELFRNFRTAMASDIEELLIAKGFSLKGPYDAHDEMVFEDKKRTEILIQIEIAPQFTAFSGGWRTNVSLLGANYSTYSYSAKVSLIGKINLTGIEPLTNEKLWSKSVSIPNIENISLETSNRYNRTLTWLEILNTDPGIYNAVGKALQSQYAGIMEKIAAHFNIQELASLKNQIKELKMKKGY